MVWSVHSDNMASPGTKDFKQASHMQELKKRLDKCWDIDID